MSNKTYHLFISHAWSYNEDYYGLINLLNSDTDFSYKNYSVPKHDPADASNDKKLKEILTNQMRPSSVVLILAGMYANHSKWIQYEIDEAIRMEKPIIAVRRWGQERVPTQLQDVADEIIHWQTSSIVNAIKELG